MLCLPLDVCFGDAMSTRGKVKGSTDGGPRLDSKRRVKRARPIVRLTLAPHTLRYLNQQAKRLEIPVSRVVDLLCELSIERATGLR